MPSPRPSRHPGRAGERAPLALAVDVGSSSVRAILYDRRGWVVDGCSVQLGYSMHSTAEGGVFVAVDRLLDLVGQALDELVGRAGDRLGELAAAGLTCFSHSLVGLDGDGQPVTPVLSWADTTSAAAADALRGSLDGGAVWRRTGAPLHASYWPARIHRQRAVRPDVRRWSGFGELLGEWLTGRRAASISMASSTGLLDRASDDWDEELRAALEVPRASLPELVADDEPLGRLRSEHGARWPALAGVTWFPAWTDAACGNVGLGCRGPERAALMIGTSSAMRVLLDRRDVEPPPGLFCFRLGDRGSLLGGQLSEGGGTAAWVGRLTNRPLAELDRLAAEIPPIAHGLVMLPYLSGERGPGYHARARAVVDGLSLGSGAGELFRAALESVALGLGQVYRLLGQAIGSPPHVVAAGGGVAHSRLWPQIIADVLARPIELPAAADQPSARGAALLALHYAEGAALEQPPPTESRVVEPDPERGARYAELLERRLSLYERMEPDWR